MNESTTITDAQQLAQLSLPELWARFKQATGENTKSPNKKFLTRRIHEALVARANAPASTPATPPAKRRTRTPKPPATTEAEPSAAPKPQRGRFASMSIEQLQAKYLAIVGRCTGSDNRRYLVWKIHEAEKGRIHVGPRKDEPLDVKILPLRLERELADRMDQVWRARGFKSRTAFLRAAIGACLAQLGARDVALLLQERVEQTSSPGHPPGQTSSDALFCRPMQEDVTD